MIKIEKGLTMPTSKPLTTNEMTDAIAKLEVGDSFKIESLKDRARFRTYATMAEKITGKKFAIHKIDGEKQKYRLWRTK